jgi:hypothetical protein
LIAILYLISRTRFNRREDAAARYLIASIALTAMLGAPILIFLSTSAEAANPAAASIVIAVDSRTAPPPSHRYL